MSGMSTRSDKPQPNRVREILGLSGVMLGAILFLSLVSYHPSDPSWNVTGTGTTRNVLGTLGAHISDLMFQFFGNNAYIIAGLCLFFAFAMMMQRRLKLRVISIVGYCTIGLLSASLWHLMFGIGASQQYSAGGVWGQWLAHSLQVRTGIVGAYLFVGMGILLALIWTTNFSFLESVSHFARRMAPHMTAWWFRQQERFLDWRDHFARWRGRSKREASPFIRVTDNQWAVADGLVSELPALELDSVWLESDAYDSGFTEEVDLSALSNLPVLTPPEHDALFKQEPDASSSDQDSGAFWSDEAEVTEATEENSRVLAPQKLQNKEAVTVLDEVPYDLPSKVGKRREAIALSIEAPAYTVPEPSREETLPGDDAPTLERSPEPVEAAHSHHEEVLWEESSTEQAPRAFSDEAYQIPPSELISRTAAIRMKEALEPAEEVIPVPVEMNLEQSEEPGYYEDPCPTNIEFGPSDSVEELPNSKYIEAMGFLDSMDGVSEDSSDEHSTLIQHFDEEYPTHAQNEEDRYASLPDLTMDDLEAISSPDEPFAQTAPKSSSKPADERILQQSIAGIPAMGVTAQGESHLLDEPITQELQEPKPPKKKRKRKKKNVEAVEPSAEIVASSQANPIKTPVQEVAPVNKAPQEIVPEAEATPELAALGNVPPSEAPKRQKRKSKKAELLEVPQVSEVNQVPGVIEASQVAEIAEVSQISEVLQVVGDPQASDTPMHSVASRVQAHVEKKKSFHPDKNTPTSSHPELVEPSPIDSVVVKELLNRAQQPEENFSVELEREVPCKDIAPVVPAPVVPAPTSLATPAPLGLMGVAPAIDAGDENGQLPLIKERSLNPAPEVSKPTPSRPRWKAEGYEPPSLDFLNDAGEREQDPDLIPEHLLKNAEVLEKTLENFGVRGKVKEILPGPVITLYEYLPAPGIKVSKIAGLSDDLAMALHALQVRVIAPIPGKGVVGIELPNKIRENVYLKEVLDDEEFKNCKMALPLAMGKDTTGKPYMANLVKMPHLLIAGTTGSGKSVGVNGMICSLLYNCSPEEVRFLMIDPKMLELSIYDGIPHLLLPVVTDSKKASQALSWAVSEMERRYQLMAEAGVRNINNYNGLINKRCKARDRFGAHEEAQDRMRREAAGSLSPEEVSWEDDENDFDLEALGDNGKSSYFETFPYIVIIIDELADLMMVAAKEVEFSIARLAQMARAAGLHLMLATQRPSVDVLTGVIKANFPSRLAFQVKSKIDSRTILDQPGAEKLLGMGDMLLVPPGSCVPTRIHGAFVSEEEIHKIVNHLKTQGEPDYNEEIIKATAAEEAGGEDNEPVDVMYDQACNIVLETRNASISHLQRKLRIGYNRAARIIEFMEKEKMVGPQIGSKPREVLVPPPQE